MNLQNFKCQRCGASLKSPQSESGNLCSDCLLRDFISTLDQQKLDLVREQLRSYGTVRAVSEARTHFGLNLGRTVELINFLRREQEFSPQTSKN